MLLKTIYLKISSSPKLHRTQGCKLMTMFCIKWWKCSDFWSWQIVNALIQLSYALVLRILENQLMLETKKMLRNILTLCLISWNSNSKIQVKSILFKMCLGENFVKKRNVKITKYFDHSFAKNYFWFWLTYKRQT